MYDSDDTVDEGGGAGCGCMMMVFFFTCCIAFLMLVWAFCHWLVK